jgi:hypothetical protein
MSFRFITILRLIRPASLTYYAQLLIYRAKTLAFAANFLGEAQRDNENQRF